MSQVRELLLVFLSVVLPPLGRSLEEEQVRFRSSYESCDVSVVLDSGRVACTLDRSFR